MNPAFEQFRQRIMHPVRYRLFLLSRLPLVYVAGIRLQTLTPSQCVTTAHYRWITQNPFRSMYFAVMNMAAELSTGVLCMGNIYGRKPPVSMLVVSTETKYYRKGIGTIRFVCNDGALISDAIADAIATGEGREIRCLSSAINESGETIAECWITWSVKAKS